MTIPNQNYDFREETKFFFVINRRAILTDSQTESITKQIIHLDFQCVTLCLRQNNI